MHDPDDATRAACHAAAPARLAVGIDDFGLHDGVNEAALVLARGGRVSAIGCLVDAPAWPAGAAALAALPVPVDVGLHLNLTQAFGAWPAARARLPVLVARALAGRLAHPAVAAEVRRQLDAFEDALGRPPDFVDGHQHVHQLPGVREILVRELLARCVAGARPAWLRSTRAMPAGALDARARAKQSLVAALGAAGLARLAQAAHLPLNAHLLGVYGFGDGLAAYRRRLTRWLAVAQDGDLLMCHAAAGPCRAGDAIGPARRVEFQALQAPGFAADCARAGMRIERLSAWRPGRAADSAAT